MYTIFANHTSIKLEKKNKNFSLTVNTILAEGRISGCAPTSLRLFICSLILETMAFFFFLNIDMTIIRSRIL